MSQQLAPDPNLARILEHVPGILWATDRDMRFTSWYGGRLGEIGWTHERVVGRTVSDLFGESEEQVLPIAAHRQALLGEVVDYQQDWCGRSFHVSVKPHRDGNGDTIGCIGIAQDITERRHSEELAATTRRFQDAVSRILLVFRGPEPITEQLDRCLEILLAIPQLGVQARGAIFTVEPDEQALVLKSHRNLLDSLLDCCARVPYGRCLCGTAASTCQVVFSSCLDDRHETRYEGIQEHGHYCVPMLAEEELVGVLTLYLSPEHARDTLEEQFLSIVGSVIAGAIKYRQTAEALRNSEERFALAVRGTDAGIFDWDLSTDQVYYSPRWKSMIGYEDHELGHDLSEWQGRIHPDDQERALATVRDYLEGKSENYELQHRLQHKDGSYRCILARGAVFRDEAGTAFRMVGSHLDITQRRRMERTVREQRAELIAAEEIQSYLLPKSAPRIPGFEIAGRCYPAAFTAGDHFDFLFLPDGSFFPVISDVCGHGVGPAILMASVHANLRSLVAVESDIGRIASRLNSVIAEESPEQRFVTLLAGEIDLQRRTLYYVRCGHPPGIVMRASGVVSATLEHGHLPLGVYPETEFRRAGPIQLDQGDTLVMFTDGILEVLSPRRVAFGKEGLVTALRAHRDDPAEQIIEAICASAREFANQEHFADDVTILVIKVL